MRCAGDFADQTPTAAFVANGGAGDDFVLHLDTQCLHAGAHLQLCTDLDGAEASTLGKGDAGVEVYISGVSAVRNATARVYVVEEQVIQLECAGGCSPSSMAYLADACDSRAGALEPAAIGPWSSGPAYFEPMEEDVWPSIAPVRDWVVRLNTLGLGGGRHYRLCTDLDGPGDTPLRTGDTGIAFYASAVLDASPRWVRPASRQELQLTCSSGCKEASEGYLATTCDGSYTSGAWSSSAFSFVRIPSHPSVADMRWRLQINAAGAPARVYHLCTDIDGAVGSELSPGDTGLRVYVSPARLMAVRSAADHGVAHRRRRLSLSPTVELFLACDGDIAGGCSAQSLAALAAECSNASALGVGADTFTPFVAAPAVEESLLWSKALALGEAALLNATRWSVRLPVEDLHWGSYFEACTALGDGALSPDTVGATDSAFVSGVGVLLTPGIGQEEQEAVTFTCPFGCSEASEAYLARTCDTADYDADVPANGDWQTESRPLVRLPDFEDTWQLQQVRSVALAAGLHYRLCVDLDGLVRSLAMGDTTLSVYVAGVRRINGATAVPLTASGRISISLECTSGCSSGSQGYLATDCYAAALAITAERNAALSEPNASVGNLSNSSEWNTSDDSLLEALPNISAGPVRRLASLSDLGVAPALVPKRRLLASRENYVLNWVGCYVEDASHDLPAGPQTWGYNTETCAAICIGYLFMALQDDGWCSCGNDYGTAPQYVKRPDGECGSVCVDDIGLDPLRYCGAAFRNAIYMIHLAHRGKVYYTDYLLQKIYRANNDGSSPEVIATVTAGRPMGVSVAAKAGKVYWATEYPSKIQRMDFEGGPVEDVVTGLSWPQDIFVEEASERLYWADATEHKIQRAYLNGSGLEDIASCSSCVPISVQAVPQTGKAYWTASNTGKIYATNLDGTGTQELLALPNSGRPAGIAADAGSGRLYWADNSGGKIQSAPLGTGSPVQDVADALVDYPIGIDVDGKSGMLYWINHQRDVVQKATVAGGGMRDLVASGLQAPWGVAVDVREHLPEGLLRLSGGTRGRLEIFHDGKWGTVCNRCPRCFGGNLNPLDPNNAEGAALAVCRQFGFFGLGLSDVIPAGTPPSLGPIWMSDLQCDGTEDRLDQCSHAGWGSHSCTHADDVGVTCIETESGPLTWEGCYRGEVYFSGPRTYGYNTHTCAQACWQYEYFSLFDGGLCSCGTNSTNGASTNSTNGTDVVRKNDTECGITCLGEKGQSPTRYCGSYYRSAVYRKGLSFMPTTVTTTTTTTTATSTTTPESTRTHTTTSTETTTTSSTTTSTISTTSTTTSTGTNTTTTMTSTITTITTTSTPEPPVPWLKTLMEELFPLELEVVECTFAFRGRVESLFYNGENVTETVEGDLSDWRILKSVNITRVPGAYFVVSGHGGPGHGDACGEAGFQVSCGGTMPTLLSTWEAIGSSTPIDAEHRAGRGVAWHAPCFSAADLPSLQPEPLTAFGFDGEAPGSIDVAEADLVDATFNGSGNFGNFDANGTYNATSNSANATVVNVSLPEDSVPRSPKMWATFDRYAAFRGVLFELVTCEFTIDGSVDSVFYNEQNITESVTGDFEQWNSSKRFSFVPVPGARLAIAGRGSRSANSFSVDADSRCAGGSFQIVCSSRLIGNHTGWQAFSQAESISSGLAVGEGAGWGPTCPQVNSLLMKVGTKLRGETGMGYAMYDYRLPIIWAADGDEPAVFRWSPSEVIRCDFSLVGTVDSVYFNGYSLMPWVSDTAALVPPIIGNTTSATQAKHIAFWSVPGAYLVISGEKDAEDESSGFQMVCSNDAVSGSRWEAHGSPDRVDPAHRSGAGFRWHAPTFPLGGSHPATSTRRIWAASSSYAALRWQDHGTWELALRSEVDDGTFVYGAPLWSNPAPELFGSGAPGENTLSGAFNESKVILVDVTLNDAEVMLSPPPLLRNKFTLQELASSRASEHLHGFLGQVEPPMLPMAMPRVPTGLPVAEGGFDVSDTDTFNLQASAPEQFFCGIGFDMRRPSPMGVPRARIGSLLDQHAMCDGAGGVEGIGIFDARGTTSSGIDAQGSLGSGTVDFLGRRTFANATVRVAGPRFVPGELRLSEGHRGRLKIFLDGRWGSVCDDEFDNRDAQVVCRQLGYPDGVRSLDEHSPGAGAILMGGLGCVGDEWALTECPRGALPEDYPGGGYNCTLFREAVVECVREAPNTAIDWAGCYAEDASGGGAPRRLLDAGPLTYGHGTASCAEACRGYLYMSLRNNGYCSCGNILETSPEHSIVPDEDCGSTCLAEDDLVPRRYCGKVYREAVFKLWPMVIDFSFGVENIDYPRLRSVDGPCADRFDAALRSGVLRASGVEAEQVVTEILPVDGFGAAGLYFVAQISVPMKSTVRLVSERMARAAESVREAVETILGTMSCLEVATNGTLVVGSPTVVTQQAPPPPPPPYEPPNITENATPPDFGQDPLPPLEYTMPEAFVPMANGEWLLEVDASRLSPGQRYRLCEDLDGGALIASNPDTPGLPAGDTGKTLYVSPTTSVEPVALWPSNASQLMLNCSVQGACEAVSGVYLSSGGCDAGPSPTSSADEDGELIVGDFSACVAVYNTSETTSQVVGVELLDGGLSLALTIDTRCLSPGRWYQLCLLGNATSSAYEGARVAEYSGLSVELLRGLSYQ